MHSIARALRAVSAAQCCRVSRSTHGTLVTANRPIFPVQLAFRQHMMAERAPQNQLELFEPGLSLLEGKPDPYRGVTVKVEEEVDQSTSVNHFLTILQASIQQWKLERRRGIWLSIPKSHGHLVGAATQSGFDFHHAQPGYVMLTKWLPTDEESRLPTYAHHYIGVGGFVVNDRKEMLVVKERYRDKDHWKLPGGLSDVGEDLKSTAVREVLEETGVTAEFVSFVGFREKHNYSFGRDDLYFVALLRAINTDITHCRREIEACMWMPIVEYIASPLVNPTNKHIATCVLQDLTQGFECSSFYTHMDVLSHTLKAPNGVYCSMNENARKFLLDKDYVRQSGLRYYRDMGDGTPAPDNWPKDEA
eukprot:comp21597_c0_seq1/m.30236 comp21597_c0_seq1/g.30236  ORF comp21597_c0_seq1/g.30236 comp21597_c0_seq1/m.30236 type:complete len:362 (-) comp21597_c0_seq1:921-2006(-)